MSERLVVIGADAAGMSAASQARRRRGFDDLTIVAFDRGGYGSYSACGIPYLVSGTVADLDSLIARSLETFAADFDIDVRLRHEILDVDPARGAVLARDLDGGTEAWESFDQLMIATGAVPRRPPCLASTARASTACRPSLTASPSAIRSPATRPAGR